MLAKPVERLRNESILSEQKQWLSSAIGGVTDHLNEWTPTQFSEEHRYLPPSVTAYPGPISFDFNPYMREIIDCADINSPVREVTLKKGVQITYTTALESILMYFMFHLKSYPCMYVTADRDLAAARIENNIVPMIAQSGFDDHIQASDTLNKNKQGSTVKLIQWKGGGYLVPLGARSPGKMRQASILLMLKDEMDGWPDVVDGDPDKLTDDRCAGFYAQRKIFRGSTPLFEGTSRIQKAYLRGDQRQYRVLCLSCNAPQVLRWHGKNKETGKDFGFFWETEGGTLVNDSVHYRCRECQHPHYEYHKKSLFSDKNGAHWHPTATPKVPDVRSYHLPSLYAPYGFMPWSACVASYLEAYDISQGRVLDIGKYQAFYNNVLAETFSQMDSKVSFQAVSRHRVREYVRGHVPNSYAEQFSGGPILFLTCQVDVHKTNLSVAVFGWCRGFVCYLIDYLKLEDTNCEDASSKVWVSLADIIENKIYRSDDDKEYCILITLIDAGYQNDLVINFCSQWNAGVFPIIGRDRSNRTQMIKEFAEFKTQIGTVGYRILVDYYKDRLSAALRSSWEKGENIQPKYYFNAPWDITDKELKELTVEYRKESRDKRGHISYAWHRPNNARNELWDLLVYGHAAVEMIAWSDCITMRQQDHVDWDFFWAQYEK